MLNKKWDQVLLDLISSREFKDFISFIDNEYKSYEVFPKKEDLFRVFQLTDYDDVKIVLLGQDPYHGPGQANGLAFSVNKGVKLPPSLRNIFKELNDDLSVDNKSGDLESWARQGVFLLNSVLTVRKGQANFYKKTYWSKFTDTVINRISKKGHVIFILLGRDAQEKKKLIEEGNYIIETSHPSPLGAYRGFLGSKIFSKANNILKELGREEIDWKI